MRNTVRAATLASLIAACAAAPLASLAASVKVGAPAPTIKVAKWVKGTPVTSFKPGNIYVVEFWATWCGPCRQSIPHLTEMAKKYAGKVTFTGVSVWEDNQSAKTGSTAYMQKVNDFVKEMGDKMAYNVAVDDPKGFMAETWMRAAEQNGIPTAFVIDKTGKIAWIGHPMGGLDQVLDKVLAGTFDAAAEARVREAEESGQKQMQADMRRAATLVGEGKTDEGFKLLDDIAAKNPQMKAGLGMYKFQLLIKNDEAAAYKMAASLGANEYKDNAMALNQIAWMIADTKTLKTPDYSVAIELARRADQLTKSADPMIMDTLAYALFKSGKVDEAIAVQEKAVALLASDKTGMPAETKKEITDRLAEFKKAKNR